MLEARVGRPEDDMKEVKAEIREVRTELGDVRASIARIEGRLDMLVARTPTPMQLWTMILTTWTAGAGIVFMMLKLFQV